MTTTDEVARPATANRTETNAPDVHSPPHSASTFDTPEHTPRKETNNEDTNSSSASQDAEEHRPNDEENALEKTVSTSDGVPLDERSKGKIAIIMLALMLAVFLAALDVTIITTALPTIAEHFHSTAGYSWIGSAFLLANSASIPSWGKISDIFGRKPMLLLANVIFMIGSLIAALSTSIGMLIAARGIQGIGGGGLVILVNITIGDLFSLRSRGAYYGMVGAVWAIASAIGPIIGGAFTQYASWRWCFYINLPLDGLALVILFFFLDLKTPRTPFLEGLKAIDWVGTLSVVGATLMLLLGLQFGGVIYPWGSATTVCLLVFSAVLFVIFGVWEYKYAKYPVIPMSIFANRTNIATLSVVFAHGFVFISGAYYLPLWFQAIRGAKPIQAGVDFLPTALSLAVTSIGTGLFIKKTGWFLPPIWFGMTMMALGYGLFIDLDAHSSWAKLIIYQIIAGLGTGPLFQSPIIALQAHIHPRDIATGTSTLGFIRQLSTSCSVVIGQVVFQNAMDKKQGTLVDALGPKLAKQLGGASAGANTQIIHQLPPAQAEVVEVAFADSLKDMWIMYAVVACVGVIAIPFIKKKVLSREHQETKTGLEAEKENAELRDQERAARKESKQNLKNGHRPNTAGSEKPSVPTIAEDTPRNVADIEKGQA